MPRKIQHDIDQRRGESLGLETITTPDGAAIIELRVTGGGRVALMRGGKLMDPQADMAVTTQLARQVLAGNTQAMSFAVLHQLALALVAVDMALEMEVVP